MRPTANLARTTLRLMRLLREAPRRPSDLVDELRVSRPTVERILRAIREEGEPLDRTARGREVWYAMPRG
jgi:DNA-binding MarR family transcriptional regulator